MGEVIKRLGLLRQVFKGDIDSHLAWSEMPPLWRTLRPFSMVRHPWAWVRSRWSHSMEHGITADYRHYGINRRFDNCVRRTFLDTVKTVLRVDPGVVSWTFHQMQDGIPIGNLRCTDDLPGAAYELLSQFEDVDPVAFAEASSIEPFNGTSTMDKYKAEFDAVPESIVQRFIESEAELVRLYESVRRNH